MRIQEIKKDLENEGYATFLLKDFSLTVGQKSEYNKKLSFNIMQSAFGVEIRKDLIIVDYAIGQIPVEKEFKTIEELLKFVRQVFPLEE
ncbi:hypothetical protein [uncultured Chryseobacterium sp.]|uniref:hypothetical protein n=1 Tax=uncultured Chryseobacterium sp. TaxID=259322 RepID=UPI0025E2D2D3|nr:hypothetical protein [uncultured Chryseobacterium sp.]